MKSNSSFHTGLGLLSITLVALVRPSRICRKCRAHGRVSASSSRLQPGLLRALQPRCAPRRPDSTKLGAETQSTARQTTGGPASVPRGMTTPMTKRAQGMTNQA